LEKGDDDSNKSDKMRAVAKRVNKEECAVLNFQNEVQFNFVIR
jgi:hypothetical protein